MIACVLAVLMLLSGVQPDAGIQDAIALYERGKFNQAAGEFKKLAEASPANAEIRIWLGKTHLKLREWDKAVAAMERAVQLQPDNARYHLWLGRACGEKASNVAFFRALGWARRVVKEFETARTLAPEDLDVRFDLLEYYLEAPGMVGGGREKAEAEVQAITRLNKEKGYTARATVHSKDKKWELARRELQQAVAEHPESISACKDLAAFLLDRGDYEGALDYAQKALDLDAASKRARLIAAAAKIRLKRDPDETAAALQKLAAGRLGDGDPAFEEVYYWLGEGFLARGDKAKAREAFRTALGYNPAFGKAKDSLAGIK
jgi:tetratricopeptide (TPR) repeat protein